MSEEASEAVAGLEKALVDAVGHRVGYAIFRVLTERPASATELAALLSQPRSTVGDQLRKLIASGLVESAGEKTRRGTTERFYRAASGSRWLDDDATSRLDPRDKRRTALRVVREAAADTSLALQSDRLDHRNDWCVGSSRIAVDSKGWKELADIHRKALEEVERVRAESADRLDGEAEEPLRAISWVMLLEMPD
ncbi:MAG TPA: winged helix-turn-helix domain-containing protein [Solirubrobacterales bacterium]|nr:winged helix-turn-helix domain-containing protein [Solirubrobacterales bacterium]